MITIEITNKPNAAYCELAWDVFFRQRGRGLDLKSHFPWIETSHAHIWYVLARHGEAVVGGLTVSEHQCAKGVFGVIGLVCVDASVRGQKIASRLMQMAIEQAQTRGCGALTLWTGQPHLYAGQGFVVQDGSAYGWVMRATGEALASVEATWRVSPSDRQKSNRGVPPFALSMTAIESTVTEASIIMVNDANGPIVAQWQGADMDIEVLLHAALPGRFRLNCRREDSLVTTMQASGWTTMLQPSNLQMWRVLDPADTPRDWDNASRLRLLDRI